MQRDSSTEDRILASARKIFLDRGLEGARMQDIADDAGINKALLHYYFRNKEKLFDTIFVQVVDEFLPRIFAILNGDQPLFEKIKLFCSEYIGQIIQTPYVPMFIIQEVNRDPQRFIKKVMHGKHPPFQKIIAQINQEIKQGIIKPTNPVQLLLNIISLCIFPFLARPMIQTVTGMSNKDFFHLMEQRSEEVCSMIIYSIKA
ncbi:MAG: TetR/AcrR family transcriptional regulator [Williamsia sp.]|nr:TetR/AcrR family transcriptional regulator [Williamsia sp.]